VPGPYDISTEPMSYSKRLPIGLGSESLVSSLLAPLAVEAMGSLGRRHIAYQTLGRAMGWREVVGGLGIPIVSSMFGTAHPSALRLEKALGAATRSGGAGRTARILQESALKEGFGHVTLESATLPGRTRTVVGGIGPTGQGIFREVPVQGYAVRAGGRTAYYDTFEKAAARASRLNSKFATRGRSIAVDRASQLRGYSALRGLGVSMVALQLSAFAADISRGVSERVMDWRPRRNVTPQHEFAMPFLDTQAALTQRQRALMAMHDSQLTTRAILGNEAAWVHG
jgi:hypothetical protein